jgi:Fe-S cluster assembly ATP-binding protein
MITHYQRLLNYVEPDYIHVMRDGKIITSGGKDLALQLEENGYDWLYEQYAPQQEVTA